jgi:hypothetical protein
MSSANVGDGLCGSLLYCLIVNDYSGCHDGRTHATVGSRACLARTYLSSWYQIGSKDTPSSVAMAASKGAAA